LKLQILETLLKKEGQIEIGEADLEHRLLFKKKYQRFTFFLSAKSSHPELLREPKLEKKNLSSVRIPQTMLSNGAAKKTKKNIQDTTLHHQ
jgi:hypothetical protein